MPSKNVRLDRDAYRALESARQHPRESFSAVIKRTFDDPPARDFSELLDQLRDFASKGVFTTEERAKLRRRQRQPLRSRSRVKRSSRLS